MSEWIGYTDWLTPDRISAELHIDVKTVREWPRRSIDPLPVWMPPGHTKQWRAYRKDMDEWIKRNWKEIR